MLGSSSFSRLAQNAPRVPSNASRTRHRRGPSQGRRPKAERIISMTRNASHKTDTTETQHLTPTPNWTKNEKYCVTRLPARPSQLDNIAQFPLLNGTISSESSYALISTPECVYVWSYATQHSDPVVLTFPVRSTEPSLAALVSPNVGSREPGLLLIKPSTGKTAYWDAVGSAIAEGLIQRSGVQTSLPLAQGETITYLCNAEPAGFVVATSSGTLWDVSVRDSEGRPNLSFVAMTNKGAWLSSLTSFIGTGHARTNIVALKPGVRDGNSERREVYVATKRGLIEKWELARGGVYRYCGQGDISTQLHEKLAEQTSSISTISIVDIAAVPSAFGSSEQLVILLSFDTSRYAILQCQFTEHQPPRVLSGTILPPTPPEYSSLRQAASSQPQLHIPSPGRTAFIAYSRGLSIVSLPADPSSSDWPYCDTISFRDDTPQLRIIASGQEDYTTDRTSNRKLRNPGMILVIQNAGVVRVETFDADIGNVRLVTSGPEWIQSKIEQAVFYGISAENPLDFKPRQDWNWKLHDVEKVTVKISGEILSSTSRYTQPAQPFEEFLSSRCHSLLALAQYLRTFFPGVSYGTRQNLLLDAEKAKAVQKLWQIWSARLELQETHERGPQIFESVVKDMRREATGEAIYHDVVREWFRNDASKIGDLLVRSLRLCQKHIRSQYGKDPMILARTILETNEIVLYSLSAAHEFRIKHQDTYSVQTPGPDVKLPSALAPWTSSPDLISTLIPQYDATLSVLRDFHTSTVSEVDPAARKTRQQTDLMEKDDMRLALEETLSSLAETLCKICVERVTWSRALAQDEQDTSSAEEIWKQYLVKRGDWIKPLSTFGRSDKALDIAEEYRDFKTLVELCLESRDDDINHVQRIHERLEYYFMHYGEEFAFTLYNYYIQNQMFAQLLQEFPREKQSLSKFLQPPKYEKLRWIHELSLSQYQDASHTLLQVSSHERRLRQKKLALSIAKLSLLVISPAHLGQESVENVGIGLTAINAQYQFYEEMIKPVVEHSIDNQARVEVALENLYIARNLKKTHLRTRLVKRGLEVLVEEKVVDPESLIDLLTLKKRGHRESDFETYFWALQVLRSADLPQPRKELALRLIWLRAYLQDDWPKIEGLVLAMPEDEIEAAWRATAVYQIIRNAMNYQVMGSTISPFQPYPASEILLPDKPTLVALVTPRLTGWSEADIDRYVNELLAENDNLKKWAGKLESDEARLLGSLQSLAKKDLDVMRGLGGNEDKGLVLVDEHARHEIGDVEMTY